MEKTNKFVDPMDKLFVPPNNKSRWENFRTFLYNSEKGTILGRTPSSWAKITTFYIIFYACLAGFFAVCIWGLLQSISEDRPTYQLDDSIIGSSPGLASRPLPPEGRESVMVFNYKSSSWDNVAWPDTFYEFLTEYQNNTSGNVCNAGNQGNKLPCKVDIDSWKQCKPDGTQINEPCLYFKINKVLEWKPSYFTDMNNLPSGMPETLKQTIKESPEAQREMVWLSCEGRHDGDKQRAGNITYHPAQGFPGYYFPFRRQQGYMSPVVAVHFDGPQHGETIDLECRAWAPNINQDRKEQLGVLNFKLKFAN